jgi:hypothetical protein
VVAIFGLRDSISVEDGRQSLFNLFNARFLPEAKRISSWGGSWGSIARSSFLDTFAQVDEHQINMNNIPPELRRWESHIHALNAQEFPQKGYSTIREAQCEVATTPICVPAIPKPGAFSTWDQLMEWILDFHFPWL